MTIKVNPPGQPDAPDWPVASGRIAFVDRSTVEPVSGKVRVWAEIDNARGGLMDGLTCTMLIDRAGPDDAFELRRSARPGQGKIRTSVLAPRTDPDRPDFTATRPSREEKDRSGRLVRE